MSKYYSEKEVRRILSICDEMTMDECLEDMTPIELPTVIEIVSEASIYGKHCNIFSDGVNWTLDKIKRGEK